MKHYFIWKKARACRYNPSNSATTVQSYVDIPVGDEAALTAAVAQIGPISGEFHEHFRKL